MNANPSRMPLANRLLYWLARFLLAVLGWRVEGQFPDLPKYVVIIAPHTSYLDVPILLIGEIILTQGFFTLKTTWLAKHTAFRGPLGALLRWLGGMPVDRRSRHNLVEQLVEAFRNAERLVIVITPEGTRKKTTRWRTGFYYIAHGAQVPIVLGFLNWKRRVVGLGPMVTPSGNMGADMEILREFYSHYIDGARHPERVGDIRMLPLGASEIAND